MIAISLLLGIRYDRLTETTITQILFYLIEAVYLVNTASPALLDMSAAFDMVNHQNLQKQFYVSCGISLVYPSGLMQHICSGNMSSSASLSYAICGEPQGLDLGPVLFISYTLDLAETVTERELRELQYVDGCQTYCYCQPATPAMASAISPYIDSLAA
jgi:hypothetical protein